MKKIFLCIGIFIIAFSQIGIKIGKVAEKKQKVICIDPGHQRKQNLGREPIAPGSNVLKTKVSQGTSGVVTRKPEYKLNLEVAFKLRDALNKKNYKVYMTRTTHEVNMSNVDRAVYCNQKKADLTIRIHADGSTNKKVEGLSVLYPTGKTSKKVNETSRKMAEIILNELIKTTKAKKGYVTGLVPRPDITGFNWSTTPVILVEMGFMSNPAEDRNLSSNSYQSKLVQGMVTGIEKAVR